MGRVLTQVALCGEVEAHTLAAPLPNGLATQLFAYLVLHRRRPVRHAVLADALWPTSRPRDPRAVLSSLLSRLRRSLGNETLPVGQLVQLVLPPDATVDVDEAAIALVAARAALERGEPLVAWEQAGRAREIAGRGLLVGFEARWIDPWRTDVESTHLGALELLARAGALLGGSEQHEGERAARRAISRAPLRESAHAALMEALAARGAQSEALQVYEHLRRSLDAELGAVPSPAVRQLHQRLLESASPAPAAERADARTPEAAGAAGGAAAGSAGGAGGTGPAGAAAGAPAAVPLGHRFAGEDPRSPAARLGALRPVAQRLVERAAALGEVAAVELLVALEARDGGGSRLDVLEALQEACDASLLAPSASWLGPAVAFAHRPDGEAVVAGMPLTRPATIAAAALEELEAGDGDRVAIARTAVRAVPAVARDEAVARAREGVELLLRGRAFDQAAELAERALALGPARRDRVALLLDLGRARRRDDPDRAWRAAVSACAAAAELDDPLLQARAALATGASGPGEPRAHADGGLARRLAAAVERLDAAAPAAAAPGMPAASSHRLVRAQLLARLALDRSWDDPEEAARLAAEAATLALGGAAGDDPAAWRALPLRIHARIALAQLGARRDPAATPARLARADLLAARARGEGDRAVELAALLQRLPLLGELGRARAAADDLDRVELLGAALGDRRALRIAADVRAVVARLASAPDGASRAGGLASAPDGASRAGGLASGAAGDGAGVAHPGHGWSAVRLRMALGTVAAALGEADDLARLQPALDLPRALAALARLLAGDDEEAVRRLQRWPADGMAGVARTEEGRLVAWSALAFVAARTGDRERAAALHALLLPWADRLAVAAGTVCLAPVARALGELAGALGRPEEARDHQRAAVAAAETAGLVAIADAVRLELDAYAAAPRDRL